MLIPFILLGSCCKDINEDCIKNIEDQIIQDIHYDKFFCSNVPKNYEKVYYSLEEYENDSDCQEYSPIPIELQFDGIVVTIGTEVQYGKPNISCYETSVEVKENTCEDKLSIEFILQTIDTTNTFIHNKTVVLFLNGFDDSYEVELSSTILTF